MLNCLQQKDLKVKSEIVEVKKSNSPPQYEIKDSTFPPA
jgi:hypothetical protein